MVSTSFRLLNLTIEDLPPEAEALHDQVPAGHHAAKEEALHRDKCEAYADRLLEGARHQEDVAHRSQDPEVRRLYAG